MAFIKVEHHIFQTIFVHLAVSHADFRLRHQLPEIVMDFFNRFHPIVDEIDLAAASQFLPDRIGDQRRMVFHHIGLYRQAVFGRAFDRAHIPQPRQRHMQSAGNRRRGQRQHI